MQFPRIILTMHQYEVFWAIGGSCGPDQSDVSVISEVDLQLGLRTGGLGNRSFSGCITWRRSAHVTRRH